ncbi:MAG TPA: hypothetical protein VG345_09485, partial [Bryobacteraceae bacterium]|nr:hypothetical protein [Bryobacteraceae bacterium]
MAQAGADGAHLYYTAAGGVEIGCFCGLAPARDGGGLSAIAAQFLTKSSEIVIFGRSNPGNFGREFPPDPFVSAAVTAVTAGGQTQGILMLGRIRASVFGPGELALLETFREPLGRLIAGAAAEEENEQLRAE